MLKLSLSLGLVLFSMVSHARSVRYALPGLSGTRQDYTNSCDYCEYDGNELNCSCRRSNGEFNYTTLEVRRLCPNSQIQNIEGNLTCNSYR